MKRERREAALEQRADEETEEGQHTKVNVMEGWKDGVGSRLNK